MRTYATVQGDMWDSVAYKTMGSATCMDQLMQANQAYLGLYIFPAGLVLSIPDVDTHHNSDINKLPPWKRVAG